MQRAPVLAMKTREMTKDYENSENFDGDSKMDFDVLILLLSDIL